MTERLYKMIASKIQARLNCLENANTLWEERHTESLRYIERNLLPSGSGLDCGTKIDLSRSNGEKIVLETSFHHMNDAGMYDGWTDHTITIRASLLFDIDLKIGGRDRNQIKEYLYEVFDICLRQEVEETSDGIVYLPVQAS